MAKVLLKENIRKRQNGKDALSKIKLPEEIKLWDTDRIIPKASGGTYDDLKNVRGLDPVEHMKRHNNYRERKVELEHLKTLIDAREQIRKMLNGFNNRLLAMERKTDYLDVETQIWLKSKINDVTI